jgi:hypothetical protein
LWWRLGVANTCAKRGQRGGGCLKEGTIEYAGTRGLTAAAQVQPVNRCPPCGEPLPSTAKHAGRPRQTNQQVASSHAATGCQTSASTRQGPPSTHQITAAPDSTRSPQPTGHNPATVRQHCKPSCTHHHSTSKPTALPLYGSTAPTKPPPTCVSISFSSCVWGSLSNDLRVGTAGRKGAKASGDQSKNGSKGCYLGC